MRTWLSILSLIVILSCSQKGKTVECSQFKKGKFAVIDKTSRTRWLIYRIDTIQTEIVGDTLTMVKIKWISNCEYEMLREYKRSNMIDSNSQHAILKFINEIPVKVKITATGKDYYVFESRKEGFDFVYTDTMWVLK